MSAETQTQSEPVVRITESAANQIKNLLTSDQENAGKGLRVYVEAGGCSGLQYGLVFDEKRNDDLAFELLNVPLLVDPFSANYLRGSVIDYVEELNGGGFKIKNPNAHQSCGCGKSFEA